MLIKRNLTLTGELSLTGSPPYILETVPRRRSTMLKATTTLQTKVKHGAGHPAAVHRTTLSCTTQDCINNPSLHSNICYIDVPAEQILLQAFLGQCNRQYMPSRPRRRVLSYTQPCPIPALRSLARCFDATAGQSLIQPLVTPLQGIHSPSWCLGRF
jgi:hypothetical protein